MATNARPGGTPLTAPERDRLSQLLHRSTSERAMTLEALDGFFTALVIGPELVPPSEYLPVVFGGPMSETCEFESLDEVNELLGLVMRQWNCVADDFAKGPFHLPVLAKDENGHSPANGWARGFLQGIDLRPSGWKPVFVDEAQMQWLVPMMILAHEHDEDPELNPGPIGVQQREEVLAHLIAGAAKLYEYFRQQPSFGRSTHPAPPPRVPSPRVKVGRNEACPCGSGKKYKKCCGSATVH